MFFYAFEITVSIVFLCCRSNLNFLSLQKILKGFASEVNQTLVLWMKGRYHSHIWPWQLWFKRGIIWKFDFFLIKPISFLYYEESLVSTNLNLKLFRFHCVIPRTAAGMDGTLHTDFRKSETKISKNLFNIIWISLKFI